MPRQHVCDPELVVEAEAFIARADALRAAGETVTVQVELPKSSVLVMAWLSRKYEMKHNGHIEPLPAPVNLTTGSEDIQRAVTFAERLIDGHCQLELAALKRGEDDLLTQPEPRGVVLRFPQRSP